MIAESRGRGRSISMMRLMRPAGRSSRDAVAELHRLGDVVSDQQVRLLEGRRSRGSCRRAGCGFVHPRPRTVRPSTRCGAEGKVRPGRTLAHAADSSSGTGLEAVEADQPDEPARALQALGLGQARDLERERDVVEHATPREGRRPWNTCRCRDGRRRSPAVDTPYRRRSPAGRDDLTGSTCHSRSARSAKEFAVAHLERDVVERVDDAAVAGGEALGDAVDPKPHGKPSSDRSGGGAGDRRRVPGVVAAAHAHVDDTAAAARTCAAASLSAATSWRGSSTGPTPAQLGARQRCVVEVGITIAWPTQRFSTGGRACARRAPGAARR